jgi:hypothetical protein
MDGVIKVIVPWPGERAKSPFLVCAPILILGTFFFSLPSYSSNKNRRDPLPTANVNVKPAYMYMPRCGPDDMRWECSHAAHNMSLMIKRSWRTHRFRGVQVVVVVVE